MKKRAAASGQDSGSIAFLSFRLDRRGGCLTRAGKTIPLRPKTWAVLVYLAERPSALVTKEELLDAVWPEVAVTPDTLTKSIGELRLALGDDSKRPRCIETVHRRGFRFIAAVNDTGSANADRTSVNTDPPPLRAHSDHGTPFIGRERELARLSESFEAACKGERQIVFVTGAAGMGKTALVDAFLGSSALSSEVSPVWIGRGSCVEQHGPREAYMPVLDALDRLAHRPDAERLIGLLRRVAPTWLVQMPWLLRDEVDSVRQSLQWARAERMLREFAALIEALSADLPVVLVLEDLHWSDAATVDLVAVLAQRREPARLLVLGTFRAAEAIVQHHPLSQAVRTLQLRRQCVDLPLHELSREEVERYLDECFPGAEFASTLAPVIHEFTDGHPLFVAAVVEHMLSLGWILETEPGWALSTPVQKLQLEMPDDARRMIEMQFETLNPAERRLLQVASVVGKEFPVQLLAALLGCSVEDAELRCDTLARTRSFIRLAGTSEWPDGRAAPLYAFTHELYRHAAYDEIAEGQRRRLHYDVGGDIEAAYGDRAPEVAAELVVHFERGHDYARAVVYLGTAAARARDRFANREAVGYLETALELNALRSDGRDQQLGELDVRLALGPALSDLYGFASELVRMNYERARELCAEVGTSEQLFRILYALSYLYAVRSEKVLTSKSTAELAQVATELESPAHRLLADSVLVRVALETGRLVETCRLAEQRLPAWPEEPIPRLPFVYGPDPLIDAYCSHAYALWLLGHTERARAAMRAHLVAAQSSGLGSRLVPATWFTALLEAGARNPGAALEPADQAVALATEYGFEFWRTLALAVRGWVAVQSGRIAEGIDQLEYARAAHAATDAKLFASYIFAFLAEAHLLAGSFDAGLDLVDKGLAAAESTLDRSCWPELWRIKGELLLASNAPMPRSGQSFAASGATDFDAAEQCLWRAVEVARQSEAKSLELRAAITLARAWHERRRTQDARDLLSRLCMWFDASTQSVELREARTLIAKMSAATPARRRAASTPRQAVRAGRQRFRS